MGLLDTNFVNQFTGLKSVVSFDSKTAKNLLPKDSVFQKFLTPVADRPAGDAVAITEVRQQQGQPAQTPPRTAESFLTTDAFRDGQFPATTQGFIGPAVNPLVAPDGLLLPYTLDGEEERIASISLFRDTKDTLQQALQSGDTTAPQFSSNNLISAYSRFFLQQVDEGDQEKLQIFETFTAFYVFFYGRRPRIYRYSGTLLNDGNHKWSNDLQFFYENYFRGTRSAELSAQVILNYDGKIVSGFMIDLQMQRSAGPIQKGSPFSFQVIVVDDVPVKFSIDIKSLIGKKQAELRKKKANIAAQVAQIGKNVNSNVTIAAAQAANGDKPQASVELPGVSPPQNYNPTSMIPLSTQTQQAILADLRLAGKSVGPEIAGPAF